MSRERLVHVGVAAGVEEVQQVTQPDRETRTVDAEDADEIGFGRFGACRPTTRAARVFARIDQLTLAASPPVTANSLPVTSAAASDARKTATGEMSSGCSHPT